MTTIPRGRIPSLDGLRAIAVLLVVLSHARRTDGFPEVSTIVSLSRMGRIGVDVFFVISGFLITTLLIRERKKLGQVNIKAFYGRRILRIAPAYAAFLIALGALQRLAYVDLTPTDWFAALTYTVNFIQNPAWEIGHVWSLSIEEHFYLMWPLCFALGFGKRTATACLIVCPAIRWIVLLALPESTPMLGLWTFTRLDSIAAGCLLAFMADDGLTRPSRPIVLGGLACLTVALTMPMVSGKLGVGVAPSLTAISLAVLLWECVSNSTTRVGQLLNWRGFAYIGVLSYSLYLWQQLFINPWKDYECCRFPQNILWAFVAALISYFAIERPFLTLKNRISS